MKYNTICDKFLQQKTFKNLKLNLWGFKGFSSEKN